MFFYFNQYFCLCLISRVTLRLQGKSLHLLPLLLHPRTGLNHTSVPHFDLCHHSSSLKKPDTSEKEIRLNEERFERLLKTLSSIAKNLKARLQRKTLLLGTKMLTSTCYQANSFTAAE